VRKALGNGFQEVIYQRALAIEMQYDGLVFEREKEMKTQTILLAIFSLHSVGTDLSIVDCGM
jgi:GxxExxY protein